MQCCRVATPVAGQRRVPGRLRVKADALDPGTLTELVMSGRGVPVTARDDVLAGPGAWEEPNRSWWSARSATKNQQLGQLDRAVPGLTLALPYVLGTK